jgi:hypothetical protein
MHCRNLTLAGGAQPARGHRSTVEDIVIGRTAAESGDLAGET